MVEPVPEPVPAPKLTPHDLRRVSVEAGADPRTVQRYLAGDPDRPVTSTSAGRIAAAIGRLGLNLLPATPTTPAEVDR